MPMLSTRDLDVYVEEVGNGSPLLLIMGLGASVETWVAQRDAFAAHHRVIAFDNRGAGRSGCPPAPWTVAAMAEDARAVLDALDIAAADVLGVSMGGMIAQELAITHPERVRRLIVAQSFARPDPLRRTFLLHRCWARQQGAEPSSEGIAQLPWLLSPATMNDPARLAEILALVESMPFMSPDAYARQIDAILEHRTLERLHRVRAPTLVVAAPEDVLTPVALSEEIAGAIRGARLAILPRGGHAVLLEFPEDFNRLVLDWLRETNENPDSRDGDAPSRR